MRRLDAIARAAPWLTPRRLVGTWAALALAALFSLSGSRGISRDEARILAPVVRAGSAPATAPLAPKLAAAGRAVLTPTGFSNVRAARLWTALAGALLCALLASVGFELAGYAGALLAPALFWLAPRHLDAGLSAAPDLALAFLWLAAAVSYRRAAATPLPSHPAGHALAAGALFGVALAVRLDAWVLLPLLALHAAAARALRGRNGYAGATPSPAWALLAMAVAVPAVLVAAWGVPWRLPLRELAAAMAPSAADRGPGPFVVTALALPATLVLAGVGGLVHSASRLLRAARGGLPAAVASEELLLLLLATVPFAAAAAGIARASGGVGAWLQAMPVVALLAARSLVAAARTAWPSKAARLTGALALLVLYPALRSTVHAFPVGSATWNELAGGPPGAASLGLPRQDGGEAAASLLSEIAGRARPGARVWWVGVAPAAARLYSLDGRLRPDLVQATSPGEADLAVVTIDGASRDDEYRVWSAFATARPAAGTYLDEVPLAFVYARPGAWR